MNSSNGNIQVTHENPRNFSEGDFKDIHSLTQDMWADGSGEFIKCRDCGKISGKKQVFGGLPFELYQETVTKIQSVMKTHRLECSHCGSDNTRYMHPEEESIHVIQDRLLKSLESSAVTCRNSDGELIGYAEAYVDKFENAYKWELEPHYSAINVAEMKERVHKLIGRDPSTLIVFSVLGLHLKYRTPFLFARLLKTFFESTSFENDMQPGLMEIGKNNSIYKVFMGMGGLSLNHTDPEYFNKHLEASDIYDSVIALFPMSMPIFRKKFVKNSVREILKIA